MSRLRSALGTGPPWRNLALLVAAAFFMQNLDGTIVATALPRMGATFGVAAVQLNVVITAYLLALGIFIPVSGWIADRLGAHTVFASAIAIFTLASALCALAPNVPALTAFRVLQGVGGALMIPVGRLAVLRVADKRDVIHVIAYLTWPALVAPVIAPVLGGALATYTSWRWIFVINLPLGIAGGVLSLRLVPRARAERPPPLDWAGFALTGAGLGALTYGVEAVTGRSVPWGLVGTAAAVGVALLGWSVLHLRRHRHPLLDLSVLRVATFRAASIGGSWFRMAIGAVPFVLPLLFQVAFGWTAVRAGAFVIAVFVGNLGIKPFTTPLLRRFGFRRVLAFSAVLAAVTIALCATFTPSTPPALIVAVLVLSGVFRSTGFTAYNTIVFADVAAEGMTNANTLSTAIQQLSNGLAIAAGALALRAGGPLARALGTSGSGADPYRVAFVLLAVLALIAGAEAVRLHHDAGANLTAGHRARASAPATGLSSGRPGRKRPYSSAEGTVPTFLLWSRRWESEDRVATRQRQGSTGPATAPGAAPAWGPILATTTRSPSRRWRTPSWA